MRDSFILYKVMKYRKILTKYNAYFEKAVFHSRENIKSCISQPLKYKLYFMGEVGCHLLSPLTSLSPEFQTPVTFLLVDKNTKCGHSFSE